MSWGDDLTALAGIRERLARPELLAPEEVALLVTQAEDLVRSARSVLRRSNEAVDGLESALTPPCLGELPVNERPTAEA